MSDKLKTECAIYDRNEAIVRYVIKRQTADFKTLFDIFAEEGKTNVIAINRFRGVLHQLVLQGLIEVQGTGERRRWLACVKDLPKGTIAAPNGYDAMRAPLYRPEVDAGVRPGALAYRAIPSMGLCC